MVAMLRIPSSPLSIEPCLAPISKRFFGERGITWKRRKSLKGPVLSLRDLSFALKGNAVLHLCSGKTDVCVPLLARKQCRLAR